MDISVVGKYLKENCRRLEQVRFDYLFNNGRSEIVIDELKRFQNDDGGFGNGLEPDFLLPSSSPLATSFAFQVLDEINEENKEIIKKAIIYLESNFINKRNGWFSVPKEVNNYPRAVWWNWDPDKGQTAIDASWGNPTAEILGYLWKYQEYLIELDINKLIDNAINYWSNKPEFESEHEVYCFIRLYKHLPKKIGQKLEKNLIAATQKLVNLDPTAWSKYIPQPVNFADSLNFFLYDVVKGSVESNLNFLISNISKSGVWEPSWTWHQYEDIWPKQKIKWEGILTVQNLKILRNYGKI